jgi:putative ABC transport system permease protein
VGDNYRGFRIVGTTDEIFTRYEVRKGERFRVRPGGRAFDPSLREAVVGSTAAARTGLAVGAKFNPYHSLGQSESDRHKETYVVVGVLEPTNSPSDQVVWIPIEGLLRLGGHVLRGTGETYVPKPGEALPEEAKEVSAVMLKLRTPRAGWVLHQTINQQGKVATFALVGAVMADLFEKLGWVSRVLELVAYLVVAVAAGSILASLMNTMNERRREFAILRALGARRGTVFSVIVVESAVIAGLGSVVGFAVYAGILAGAAAVVRQQTGVVIDVLAPHAALWATPLAMTALGAISGILPALRAYRTEVAENLVS